MITDQKHKEYEVSSLDDLKIIAQYLLDQDHSNIICLQGDLGSGKTTLVNSFCKLLKIEGDSSSPTFSIVNEYQYPDGLIYHFDLYRLENIEEVIDIGIEEYLFSGEYCLLEWPELIMGTILDQYIQVKITLKSDSGRKVLISKV